jgi:hypothetical protein
VTEAIEGVMPLLQVITEHVRDIGLVDFIKGFWQLPLAKASQERMSYMTDATDARTARLLRRCASFPSHHGELLQEVALQALVDLDR